MLHSPGKAIFFREIIGLIIKILKLSGKLVHAQLLFLHSSCKAYVHAHILEETVVMSLYT